MRQQEPGLADRWQAFMAADQSDAVMLVEAATLAQALAARGQHALAARLWKLCGDLHHRGAAPDLELAIAAYGEALHGARGDERWQVLMALSTCWDTRVTGTRAGNIEQALQMAGAAAALAEHLTADQRAESAMEFGLLYTRRVAGDPASNLAQGRAALHDAIAWSTNAQLRLQARYNLAVADIEDVLDRSGHALQAGVAVLRGMLEAEVFGVFDPLQQQNLLQTLAVGMARQAALPGGAGPVAALREAAALAEIAHTMALQHGTPVQAARLARVRASIAADRTRVGDGDHFDEALDLLRDAGQVLRRDTAPYDYARVQLALAHTVVSLSDPMFVPALAIPILRDVVDILTPDVDPDHCRQAQVALGRQHASLGEWAQAAQCYSVACDACERLLAGTETRARRAHETGPNAEAHALHIDALSRLQPADAAAHDARGWAVLQAMEHGRARLFLDMMGLRPLPPQPGLAPGDLEQEARLIAQLRWTLPATAPDAAPTLDADLEPTRLAEQRDTRAALDALWTRMALASEAGRRHVALRRTAPPGQAALQALALDVGPRSASLSLFVTPQRIVAAWLAPGAAPRVRHLDIDAARLQAGLLQPFARNVLSGDGEPRPVHAWQAFGDTLFGPFADQLAGIDTLCIVAHGPLHGLPLHALHLQGAPLIAQVAVAYAPSLAVLASVRSRAQAAGPAGEPLVGSYADEATDIEEFQAETNEVARLHHAQARAQLARAEVLRDAASAPLVHLACHGAYDADDPLASGVELAGGTLTAHDILALQLRCELAVLSACETGRQAAPQGDELLGLTRALLQSGAACTLSTLWRVYSDSTTQWMRLFHDAWTQPGTTRAAAFQSATLALRATDSDPRAWAAFVLTGDAR
ncbi:hypothetical protein ASF43_03470 [Pseudorhodoferax sp. Leaf267]|nr:hypothetical protein ASF43_03470 [Pseudorhodoferax sp. Leaf267]